MPFCTKASGTSKVAFVLLFPALGLHCAGYGTVFWMKAKLVSGNVDFNVGLWKTMNCTADPCLDEVLPDTYLTSLMYITRAFMSVPLVLIPLAMILGLFYLTTPRARIQKTAAWMMMSLFFSVWAILVGVTVWSFNMPPDYYVHWSLGMTLITASICVVSAVLLIQDIRTFDYEGARRAAAEKRLKKKKKKRKKLQRESEKMDLYNDKY